MALNPHHLSIFEAVARRGNVTAAAAALMISQPAVSRQIKQLERSLGTQLMVRGRRGIVLTDAGQVLAGYATRLARFTEEAEAAVADLQSMRRGRLTIAVSPTIGAYLLPRVLVRYRLKYPGIRLKVEIEQSDTLYRRLYQDDQVDVALTEVEPTSDQFDYQVFMRDTFCPIVPFGHPLAKRKSVQFDQFASAGLILRDSESAGGSFVEHVLREERIEVQPLLRLNSTEAIKEAVVAGLGVGIVSGLAVKSDLALKRLAAISLKGLSFRRPLYRVTRKGSVESKALIALMYMVKHAARGTLPGFDQPITPAAAR